MTSGSSEKESRARTPAQFATTHWSVVLAAGHGSAPDAHRALEQLCGSYWYPLYAYGATNLVTATVGPRAEMVAFALEDLSVRLWERRGEGRERWRIPAQKRVDKLHFSPDARLLFGMVQ